MNTLIKKMRVNKCSSSNCYTYIYIYLKKKSSSGNVKTSNIIAPEAEEIPCDNIKKLVNRLFRSQCTQIVWKAQLQAKSRSF